MRPLLAFIAAALGGAGCEIFMAVNSVRVGPPVAARPAPCDVRFERTAPEELLREWRRVGALCANVEDDGPFRFDFIRKRLREEACALGGELVTVAAPCSVGRVSGTEFAVMTRRQIKLDERAGQER